MLEAWWFQKSRVEYRYFCFLVPKQEHLKCLVPNQSILRSFWKPAPRNTRGKLPNLGILLSKISSCWVVLEKPHILSPPPNAFWRFVWSWMPFVFGITHKTTPSWHLPYLIPTLVGILALKWKGLCQKCWHNPELEMLMWCWCQEGVWGRSSLNQSFF